MYSVSSGFRDELKKLGKEIDIIISYGNTTISSNEIYYFNLAYDGAIMKSVMKKLELDVKNYIDVGTIINPLVGLKVDGDFEYIDYGNFYVYSVEEKKDTNSYRVVAYEDKMINAMKEYKDINYTIDGTTYEFPMTLGTYLTFIAKKLGFLGWIDYAGYRLINNDKILQADPFLDINGKDLGYTYRDVLDDIAEATGSIIIASGNYLLPKYPRNIVTSAYRITDSNLKDINVDFGEVYGPINSVVLSRSGGSDNVYKLDEQSIEDYGLCEVKIVDNQIMNDLDRDKYLDELLPTLMRGHKNHSGELYYYLNDYKSTGLLRFEVGDKYRVTIGNNNYDCLMLNDEIIIEQGLEENVYTERPEESETDYTKADTTDRRINQTYLMVDKQSGRIDGVVDDFNKYTTITDSELGKVKETVIENKSAITSLTATGGRLEVLEQRVSDNEKSFDNLVVEININGINVSTNDSAISTLIDNEKFVVMNNGTPLAFIGYDSSDGITKAEMEYLTVRTYFTVGHHRVESFEDNYENRTGWFYIG